MNDQDMKRLKEIKNYQWFKKKEWQKEIDKVKKWGWKVESDSLVSWESNSWVKSTYHK